MDSRSYFHALSIVCNLVVSSPVDFRMTMLGIHPSALESIQPGGGQRRPRLLQRKVE
jgi:hypothetical protein